MSDPNKRKKPIPTEPAVATPGPAAEKAYTNSETTNTEVSQRMYEQDVSSISKASSTNADGGISSGGGISGEQPAVKSVYDNTQRNVSSSRSIDTSYAGNMYGAGRPRMIANPNEIVTTRNLNANSGDLTYEKQLYGGGVKEEENTNVTPPPTPSFAFDKAAFDKSIAGGASSSVQSVNTERYEPTQPNLPEKEEPPGGNSAAANRGSMYTSPYGTTTEIASYEDYLNKRGDTFANIHDAQYEHAENQKETTMAGAQAEKDLALNAANNKQDRIYTHADKELMASLGFNEEQFATAIAAVNAKYKNGVEFNEEMRNLLAGMTEEDRWILYSAAERQRAADETLVNTKYDTETDRAEANKTLGTGYAQTEKDLALGAAGDLKDKAYESAEATRQRAHEDADIERERAVIDARSSYEQNKSSYGANAENLARMGLSGSGYSAYADQQAYAQQRAETQNANAQAASVKRDADYAESQAKLKADTDYIQNSYAANSAFNKTMYDVDTSYTNNMADAEIGKAEGMHAAESAERETKTNADLSYNENMTNANAQYVEGMYNVTNDYIDGTTDATLNKNQADKEANDKHRDTITGADLDYIDSSYAANSAYNETETNANLAENEGKFNADVSYAENMMANDDAIAANRKEEKEKAEAEAKEEKEKAEAKAEQTAKDKKTAYNSLYTMAASGDYSATDIENLAKQKGLDPDDLADKALIDQLTGAATTAIEKKQAANNAEFAAGLGDDISAINSAVASGGLSPEDGAARIANIQQNNYNSFAEDIANGFADCNAIDSALAAEKLSPEQYKKLQYDWNKNVDTSKNTFYNEDGAILTKSAAKALLKETFGNSWCSDETKAALQATFDSLYTPVTGDVEFFRDDWNTDLADEGNNFTLKLGDTYYDIESGGEITDTNIKEISADIADGKVFGYQNVLYLKKGKRIFKIQAKPTYQTSYNKLYAVYFED